MRENVLCHQPVSQLKFCRHKQKPHGVGRLGKYYHMHFDDMAHIQYITPPVLVIFAPTVLTNPGLQL